MGNRNPLGFTAYFRECLCCIIGLLNVGGCGVVVGECACDALRVGLTALCL